jgi:hypothetical protein
MVHPKRARDFGGVVSASVIDDQVLDHINAGDFSRQVGDRFWQRLRLIETGYLDDQLHGMAQYPHLKRNDAHPELGRYPSSALLTTHS